MKKIEVNKRNIKYRLSMASTIVVLGVALTACNSVVNLPDETTLQQEEVIEDTTDSTEHIFSDLVDGDGNVILDSEEDLTLLSENIYGAWAKLFGKAILNIKEAQELQQTPDYYFFVENHEEEDKMSENSYVEELQTLTTELYETNLISELLFQSITQTYERVYNLEHMIIHGDYDFDLEEALNGDYYEFPDLH